MAEKLRSRKRLVLIGGGTGSFTLLTGLKDYFSDITAIVNMSDDGGSTGVLRDEMGVLPPGDIRQCLVALSPESDTLRALFNYRFESGSLHGHSFGNLFLSALEKVSGSFAKSVEEASRLLNIEGRVLPVTLVDSHLVLTRTDGSRVKGEYEVANTQLSKSSRPHLSLEPRAIINPAADSAIREAEIVVIAPGHLYGSIAPALLVDGMKEALSNSSARVIYVSNLVNKPGQTDGFMVHDYASEIERFIGDRRLDVVLYNRAEPPSELRHKYAAEGEDIVYCDDDAMQSAHYKAHAGDLLSEDIADQPSADKLIKRNLIRHDSSKIAELILAVTSS